MKIAIFAVIAVTIIITLALCKASKKGDEMLEYPERIMIRGD